MEAANADSAILGRLRRRISAHRSETEAEKSELSEKSVRGALPKALDEVVAHERWAETGGGTVERVNRLSQIEVSSERNRPLKRHVLLVVVILVGLYTKLIRSALQAQMQRWDEQPNEVIAMRGPDGSALVPFLFTFWYAMICFVATRRMAGMQPTEALIFEAMVLYNLLQAAMSGYVAFSMLQEAYKLQLRFVGNASPVIGVEHHRLAMLSILHYHLRILELLDTFFLISRKKLGTSLNLHILLRVQNVWGWHIACRWGCGGDIYFPVVANAIGSTILHVHYAVSLVKPRAGQQHGHFNSFFLRAVETLRKPFPHRSTVTAVQVWVFRLCLVHGSLSLIMGAYPRSVLVVHLVQVVFGNLLYANFHYEATETPKSESSEGEALSDAKVVFSFDSSGWCYFYHYGVAMWLQEHFPEEIGRGDFAFSGSSGGGVVAAILATGTDIAAAVDNVMQNTWRRARWKPWLIPDEVQEALEKFFPADAHVLATNRLRILLTRLIHRPPFFMGEVASSFQSREHLFHVLQASCHMPVIFGLGYRMNGGRYFDGLLWPSSFVPWRSFTPNQRVCRVSAFSAVGSDIGPRWNAIPPLWWPVFPPSREVLEGLMWAGYCDIAAVFGTGESRRNRCGPCARRQSPTHGSSQIDAADSEKIKELIRIYECTAQRHWAVLIGTFGCITFTLTLIWLIFLASS